LLAASGEGGFTGNRPAKQPEMDEDLTKILNESSIAGQGLAAGSDSSLQEKDLELIRSLIEQIDGYIASGSATEDEITAIETILEQVRKRSDLRNNPASR
jgi:hypothetical protein